MEGDRMSEKSVTLPITGMTCANCAASIERGLKKLEGINHSNINFASEQAAVSFDPQRVRLKDIVENIRNSG